MDKQNIFDIVVANAREVLPSLATHPFQRTDALKDLGANSLDRTEISMMTLESLGLKIPLVEIGKVGNIGELVDVLHAKLPTP